MNFDFPEIRIPWRRLLALCLALTMCLSMLPAGALAAEEAAGAEEGAVSAQTETSEETSEPSGEGSEPDSVQPGAEASEPENALPDEAEEPASAQPEEPASDEGESAASGAEEENASEQEGELPDLELQSAPTSGDCGNDLSWTLENGTLTVSGSGGMWNWSPESTPWEESRNVITSVVLEEGVTNVGKFAFSDCVNLTEVRLPSTLTVIRKGALSGCTSLPAVTVPEGVSSIGERAFADCTSLSSAVLPATVVSIQEAAFHQYDEDEETYIPLPNLTIQGYAYSAAQTWAESNSIPFQSLGDPDFGSPNVYYGDVTGNATRVSDLVEPIAMNGSGQATINIGRTSAYYSISPDATGVYRFEAGEGTKIYVYRCEAGQDPERISKGSGSVNCALKQGETYWVRVLLTEGATGTVSVSLGEGVSSGSITKGIQWQFEDGTLTITGKGNISKKGDWGDLESCITSVVFGEGITGIRVSGLFSGYSALQSVTIPSTLTNLGYRTFAKSGLVSIDLPEGIDSISSSLFRDCTSLKRVVIPQGVTYIGYFAFYGCTSLEQVTIPESVSSIDICAFSGCTSLTEVALPSSLSYLDEEAFAGSGLESVTIPDSVRYVYSGAFENCANLRSATIGNGMTYITDRTFYGCTSLEQVSIPTGVERIDWASFEGCAALQSVTIPVGVSTIEERAFRNCTALQSVTIPVTVTSIGDYAFHQYNEDTEEYEPLPNLTIQGYAFSCAQTWAESNGIPFQSLGDPEFGSANVYYGDVTGNATRVSDLVGPIALNGSAQATINIGRTSAYYSISPTATGVYLFEASENAKLFVYRCEAGKAPQRVARGTGSVNCQLNAGSTYWLRVVLPNGGTGTVDVSLSEGVSSGTVCEGIEWQYRNGTLTITGSGTITARGNWGMLKKSVTSVVFGEGITGIAVDGLFYGATNLKSVSIPSTMINLGSLTFSKTGLESFVIPNTVTRIGYKLLSDCPNLSSVTIPNSVTQIGRQAFTGCLSLNTLVLPESVTRIGDLAFARCPGLSSVTIPDAATEIGYRAFGYVFTERGELSRREGFTISGYSHSAAENYAAENDFTFVSIGESAHPFYPYDGNPTPERATELTEYTQYDVNIWQGERAITFVFKPEESGTYTFESFDNNRERHCDPYCELYDESLSRITSNDDSAGNNNFRLRYELQQGETYYFFAKLYSDSYPGSYRVRLMRYSTSWSLDNGVLTISGAGVMEDYYNGDDAPWYSNRNQIQSVVIEQGVTSIGAYAFEDCYNLTSVSIPESVTSIGAYAFRDCSDLTSVTFAGTETVWPDSAFDNTPWQRMNGFAQATAMEPGEKCEVTCDELRKYAFFSFTPAETNVYEIAITDENDVSGSFSIWTSADNQWYSHSYNVRETLEEGTTYYIWCTGSLNSDDSGSYSVSVTEYAPPTSGECGENLTWALENGTLTISGSGDMYNFEEFAPWYDSAEQIQSAVIEEGVTRVGNRAFKYCHNLTSVSLPQSLTAIGTYAFRHCYELDNVVLPGGLVTLGNYAFANCYNLSSIVIPGSVESIGHHAFYNSDALETVTISNGVTNIKKSAFADCYNLSSVSIPASVVSIGEYAFAWCYNLTDLTLSDGLKTVGSYAFYDCYRNLSSVTIPASVESIGDYAFAYCPNLTSVSFAGTQTVWSDRAFEGTPWLRAHGFETAQEIQLGTTEVNFDDNVQTVFYKFTPGETRLYNVAISSSDRVNPSVEIWTSVDESYTSVGTGTHIQLEKGKTYYFLCRGWSYDGNEYSYNLTVEEYEIPTSGECGDNLTWSLNGSTLTISGSGDMYNYDTWQNYAPWYDSRQQIRTLVLPEGLTSIGTAAFYGCNSLNSMSIPEGVTKIGANAFQYCQGLTELTIAEGVTSIGESAFWDCNPLESVSIPASVESIGDYAFAHCDFLLNVSFGGEEPENLELVFRDTPWLRLRGYADAPLLSLGETTISFSDDYDGQRVGYRFIPEQDGIYDLSVTNGNGISVWSATERLINYMASGTTRLSLEQGKTYYFEFGGWSSSTFSYTIGLSLNSDLPTSGACGDNLTWSLNGSTLTISGSGDMYNYDTWQNYAPWYDSRQQIRTVVLPEGLTSIGSWAFYDCYNLSSVSIPEGVTSIGSWAFRDCSRLTSVTIPASVTSIGEYAFAYCNYLSDVTFVGEEPDDIHSIFRGTPWLFDRLFTDAAELQEGTPTEISLSSSAQGVGYCFTPQRTATYEVSTSAPEGVNPRICIYDSRKSMMWGEGSFVRIQLEQGQTYYLDCGGYNYYYNNGALRYTITVEEYEVPTSGTCGDNVNWALENGTLTIRGSGEMYNYDDWQNYAPWYDSRAIIKTVVIENGVTKIGRHAFSNCTRITAVNMPESLREINDSAFAWCNQLTDLVIPEGVTTIGYGAFWDCDGLTSVTIPEGVTCIGMEAFYGCNNLVSATIPASVETIGECAFGYASNSTIDGFTIYGYTGSAAEAYANENGIAFCALGGFTPGDVTGDNYVGIADVVKVNRHVVGKTTLTEEEQRAADVTGDGDVAIADVIKINRFVLELIDSLV